jgi:hypothetical protein
MHGSWDMRSKFSSISLSESFLPILEKYEKTTTGGSQSQRRDLVLFGRLEQICKKEEKKHEF